MSDIPLRAIAELKRRRQQQLAIAAESAHADHRATAEGKAEGYKTAVDIIQSMRANVEVDREPFERIEYGDDCPVCGRPVKSVVTSYADADGPMVQNSECSQYDGAKARFIFHD